ncbi:MAG: retroviral-like aspartic protease family protein [Treponema sp.]|jgi:clan AA aspartic protease|nr:retroviral-like aspartic protease family protein [Treponema sp.]
MGTVFVDITLTNACDASTQAKGLLKEQDVHTATVRAIVDTGALSLVIDEKTRQKLDLNIQGEKSARLANGQRVSCKVTEPVEVHWKDRQTACQAVVIPGAETILLGAIPLEGMDLMVNPVTRELVGIHGDEVEFMIL